MKDDFLDVAAFGVLDDVLVAEDDFEKNDLEWLFVNLIQYWLEAAADLGQESSKWTHQAHHRQRYPVFGSRNRGY